MKGLPFVLLFTAMTFLSWGAYGPVLHHGAVALEHDSMRAFVGVGLAYFLIAVLIPFMVLKKSGEKGKWTLSGSIYSLVAGAVGAIGALGIILALGAGGETVYVMPLVFGFAPVVNTLVSAMMSRTFDQISPIFVGGILAAALGAAGVLVFKPVPVQPPAPVATEQSTESPSVTPADDEAALPETTESGESPGLTSNENPDSGEEASPSASEESAQAPSNASTSGESSAAGTTDDKSPSAADSQDSSDGEPQPDAEPAADEGESATTAPTKTRKRNVPWIVFSIVIAALCWGSYGPMLHIGQAKMDGSRLRPFACVGIAYFLIAVAAPLMLIYSRTEDLGAWNFGGMTWSFLAGVAGAIGALGVILAFNAGGKPYYVMPLIFGFAPVINTFISVSESGTWNRVTLMFWLSLAVVIAGAVTVLTNAPKPKPKSAPKPT